MGGRYNGWQRQPDGVPTVQGTIEDAIFAFCQQRITLHVAGRTDAGVNAAGQVAHFDLDYGTRKLTPTGLRDALNAHLLDTGVVIVAVEKVAADFHARFQATNKLYTYRVVTRYPAPVMDAARVWHRKRLLDVDLMREAATVLLGHHDFTSFRAKECQADSPMRTLDRLDIDMLPYDAFGGQEIRFHLEARSFLHHQVRNIVGTLVKVGDKRWPVACVAEILAAKDRAVAGPTAPPEGLWLMRVDYPPAA